MNSLDPWRAMLSSPPAEMMVVPAPYYGHPFYREVPSWITPNDGEARTLFDGAFIGAEVPRKGLLAEVTPTGITARAELDQHQHLHAEICVDGKCYKSCINLAPAIAALMTKFAQHHADLHAGMPTHAPTVSGDVVLGAVDRAVAAAGDAMIGALIDQHVDVLSAGWLSDIGGAIGGTLRKLQGPITMAATAVATAYGGPAAGAAAGKFAPMLTDVQANLLDPKKDPKKTAAAKRAVQQLNREAKADPRVAQALAAAQKAVVNTAVAYHVKATAQKAAAGDPAAQRDIAHVVQAAEAGDPAAKSTSEVLANTFAQALMDRAQHSEWGAELWEKVTGRGPATVSSGGADLVSAPVDPHALWVGPKFDSPNRQRAMRAVWDGIIKEPGSPRGFYLYVEAKDNWNLYGTDDQEDLRAKGRRLLALKVDYLAVFEIGGGGPLLKQDAFPSGRPVHGRGRLPRDVASNRAEVSGCDAIVGAVFAADEISGAWVSGFWSNVKGAVLKYTGTTATNQFIKDNKLEPYVKLAATAVATAYGGPAAGAAAGALTGPVMSLGVKDKQQAAAATQDVQGVKAAAEQHSPQMAQAVDVANEAIQKTAMVYHVAKITKDAKAGVPAAQKALANLNAAAARGDVQAQQALQLASVIHREQSKAPGGAAVSGEW